MTSLLKRILGTSQPRDEPEAQVGDQVLEEEGDGAEIEKTEPAEKPVSFGNFEIDFVDQVKD